VRAIVKNDTQFLKATGKSCSLLCSNSTLSIWKNDLWNLIHLFCIQQTDPQLSGYVWSYRSCISNHHPFYSSSKTQACLNYYSQTFCIIESHNISVVSTLYIKITFTYFDCDWFMCQKCRCCLHHSVFHLNMFPSCIFNTKPSIPVSSSLITFNLLMFTGQGHSLATKRKSHQHD
jgi:hypothetical protein